MTYPNRGFCTEVFLSKTIAAQAFITLACITSSFSVISIMSFVARSGDTKKILMIGEILALVSGGYYRYLLDVKFFKLGISCYYVEKFHVLCISLESYYASKCYDFIYSMRQRHNVRSCLGIVFLSIPSSYLPFFLTTVLYTDRT